MVLAFPDRMLSSRCLLQDLLLCGTDNGYLKVLDIKTEEIITKARINSNRLSDVKELLIFGKLQFFFIVSDRHVTLYVTQGSGNNAQINLHQILFH